MVKSVLGCTHKDNLSSLHLTNLDYRKVKIIVKMEILGGLCPSALLGEFRAWPQAPLPLVHSVLLGFTVVRELPIRPAQK